MEYKCNLSLEGACARNCVLHVDMSEDDEKAGVRFDGRFTDCPESLKRAMPPYWVNIKKHNG